MTAVSLYLATVAIGGMILCRKIFLEGALLAFAFAGGFAAMTAIGWVME